LVTQVLIGLLIFIVAGVYSTVGHGGATGYVAVLTLFNFNPHFISNCALVLNMLVSLIGFINFTRAGHCLLRLFLPFVASSIPFAFMGGYCQFNPDVFYVVAAIALLMSAIRLILKDNPNRLFSENVPFPLGVVLGSIIGFVSGITGIGGGVFLSPILILSGLVSPKKTACIASVFILFNSLSAILGRIVSGSFFNIKELNEIIIFVVIALIGGFLGSYYSAQKFKIPILQKALAITLVIAAGKLFLNVAKK
jgi:uncharacterized membrane protein YfcA